MFAAESSLIPRSFSAHIGGFLGRSYQVELHEGKLVYTTIDQGGRDPKQTNITPTAEQWREFRQALEDLKVWQWRPIYPSSGALDGTQWSLEIAYADASLTTGGDNNYPDGSGKPNGKPEYTDVFKRYLGAVKKLIGGGEFR